MPSLRIATLLLALSALPCAAQTPAPAPSAPQATEAATKFRAACGADVQKFCAGVERGKGQVRACLDSHSAELSVACQAARAERAANAPQKGKS